MSLPDQSFTRNSLLAGLHPSDYALLQPHLRRIQLWRGYVMIEANRPIDHVHFMEGGVVSIVTGEGEEMLEVGLIGREGFVGAPLLLGSDRTPDRSFVQINDATSLRIPAASFLEVVNSSERLRQVLLRFIHVLAVQAARTAAANAGLELPQRLARWLLMCHDRVDGDKLALTHDFVSAMLGVRRSGVTVTLHTLEGMGLIAARRGLITVLDRGRLEELAGAAYGRAEAEYRRLLGSFGRSKATNPV